MSCLYVALEWIYNHSELNPAADTVNITTKYPLSNLLYHPGSFGPEEKHFSTHKSRSRHLQTFRVDVKTTEKQKKWLRITLKEILQSRLHLGMHLYFDPTGQTQWYAIKAKPVNRIIHKKTHLNDYIR